MSGLKRLRMPPKIKILEAAGALGDGRVHVQRLLTGEGWRALVTSSDGQRRYNVVIVQGRGHVRAFSSDNGTRLRGYIGYPIIAVMMAAGILPRDPAVEEALRGFPWRRMNEALRKYSLVMERALLLAEERGVPRSRVERFVEEAYTALKRIPVYYDPGLRP